MTGYSPLTDSNGGTGGKFGAKDEDTPLVVD
jgi:hypothetical protein